MTNAATVFSPNTSRMASIGNSAAVHTRLRAPTGTPISTRSWSMSGFTYEPNGSIAIGNSPIPGVAPQEPDRERGDGEHVREDGTERGALDAPPQPEDERGAEHDVRDRAAGSNLHRGVGVVAADQHPAADEVERGEWNAEPDDPEVVGAERDRGLVAAQHVDETRRERPEGDRDGDRDHDSEEDARPDGVAQFRVRLRAEPLGD